MPESIKDRCTKSHKYVFLLTKHESHYFDHEAIREPAVNRLPGNRTHRGTTEYAAGAMSTTAKAAFAVYAERMRDRRNSLARVTQGQRR